MQLKGMLVKFESNSMSLDCLDILFIFYKKKILRGRCIAAIHTFFLIPHAIKKQITETLIPLNASFARTFTSSAREMLEFSVSILDITFGIYKKSG